ncbi:MAG: hypothetical protein EBY49_01850, partial [Actinobacteria bacterium]|nr:hypothetical protein [Actinomycetota bacterium]
ERRATYDARWEIGGLFFLGSFNDLLLNPESNETAASYVRERIAEIVDDPETAAMLSPDTTIGCKRLVVDTDYFQTFNRSNVSLVDVSATPVEQITETAVVGRCGADRALCRHGNRLLVIGKRAGHPGPG